MSQEYPEKYSVLVNCSAVLKDNDYEVNWEICIDGDIKIFCSRFGDEKTCSSGQFAGRIKYVDAATIEVLNMVKEENGVTSCYVRNEPRVYLQNVQFIGNLMRY